MIGNALIDHLVKFSPGEPINLIAKVHEAKFQGEWFRLSVNISDYFISSENKVSKSCNREEVELLESELS